MRKIKTLGEVATYINGRAFKPSEWETSGIPIIRIQNLNDPTAKYNYSNTKYEDKYLVKKGDLLFSWSASLGAHIWKNSDAWLNQHIFRIIPNENICKGYLYHFLCKVTAELYAKSHGTGMVHITKKPFMATPIPVPSLPEQEHIVTHIEELFSELDKAVETLQTTKQQLAVYRQAVLKEAFEGKLTTMWRKSSSTESPQADFESIMRPNEVFKDTSGDENEISLIIPDLWKKVRLGEVFEVQVGATPSRRVPEYWNGDINWVSSGEVHFNGIFRTNEQITDDGLAHASTNVHPIGTVMLAMIGEGKTRGQAAILNVEAAHNQNTAAILVSKTPCSPKYIYYFLQMNYDNTRRVGSGNNQKALNKERVRALRFPFTSFAEQNQIVEEIESRLSVCESIEQTVDTALAQAEALRQSILKQAFEGRLV
jgi:type I restriction enzyme S subunit